MAVDKNITIKFVADGDKRLIKAFEGLAKGQKKFNGTTKAGKKQLAGYRKNQQRVTDSTNKMGNAFSVIRSKMLLFSFAMSLGIRQLIGFSKEAAKVDSMERAFTNMSGSVKGAEERLNALKSATNGTMSEFDLFQQANNAMILGLTRNTNEMANMFDVAQRLGRALGRDTKSSVESLVTGIGRQSRLMLDNIGIIVKTEQAYEKYAVTLGKSASALTDTERKQAFFNAAMEAAEQKLLILGAEIPTSQDALDGMAASFDEVGVNIGKAFLPILESTASLMSSLSKSFDPERAKAYLAAIVGLGVAMGIYVAHLKRAVILQTMTGWGALATGIGLVAAELLNMSGIFEDGNKSQEDARAKAVAYFESLRLMKAELLEVQLAQQNNKLEMLSGTDALQVYNGNLMTLRESITKLQLDSERLKLDPEADPQAIQDLADKLLLYKNLRADLKPPVESEDAQKVRALIAEIEKLKGIIGGSGLTYTDFSTAQEKVNALYNKTGAAQRANILATITEVQGLDESIISAEKKVEVLKMLQAQYDKTGASNLKGAQVAVSSANSALSAIEANGNAIAAANKKEELSNAKTQGQKDAIEEKYAKQAEDRAKKLQGYKVASAISNVALGITQTWRDPSLPVWAKIIATAAQATAGYAQIQTIRGQKFEQGGLVGGRRHSAGGTMIEAERGEFIMSRNAVESVGIEAMNRINAGGGGGSVNISFAGNVMSQDFIEDEAIPMIKEAIRRGADIGVA